MKFIKVFFAVLLVFSILLAQRSFATREPKVVWCHCTPEGCLTQEINANALSGHVDAEGNILHEGDHAGVCSEPSITPTVTEEPTPTPTEEVTPTPTETPQEEATPSATPTPEPTHTSDGLSDGKGNTDYSCPAERPEKPVANFHLYRNGDAARLYWLPDGRNAPTVNVYYKLVTSSNWEHSVIAYPNNGYIEITGLGYRDWTFAIAQNNDCIQGDMSQEIVDGAEGIWTLFR